jgi:hypothetical protein
VLGEAAFVPRDASLYDHHERLLLVDG